MKTMTCRQLGGACDKEFHAETFDEMATLSKEHGMEMYGKSDKEHLEAMENMTNMMNDPDAMNSWMEEKQQKFESLPVDK